MILPQQFVIAYYSRTKQRSGHERVVFRNQTLACFEGANCVGDLMPIRALNLGARHSASQKEV